MDTSAEISQLKDVHLPHAVSFFPLTSGWYILIALIAVLIVFGSWWKLIRNKYKKQKLQAYALLAEIERNKSAEMLSEVSILLKRVAILRFPQEPVHTLFGQKWVEFLDKSGKTNNFTQGEGRYLLNIYQSNKIEQPDRFFTVVKQWLEVVL